LVEQAKVLWEEAEANNLDPKASQARWDRWDSCGLCDQQYHGVVRCALGWACWKTYVGRPEDNNVRRWAMSVLGVGLLEANHEDALIVGEAELSMKRRIGASEHSILAARSNLAATYGELGQMEKALSMRRDAYNGNVKLFGEQHVNTLIAANNYAAGLLPLQRFEEARSLLRQTIPVARRALGESHELTLKMRCTYAVTLCNDPSAAHDVREAVATLEDLERTARRVLGGAHPTTSNVENNLRAARAALRAREAKTTEAITPGERVKDK